MKKNLELFFNFFKIGLFTFGGGYAMISHIKELVVDKKNWISNDDLIEMIAISESTPGPIAINMATFIGYHQNKFLGSLFSTLGVVLPSFIIIFIISLFLDQFMALQYVQYAFQGIKCAVGFLIIKAGVSLLKSMEKNVFSYIIFFIVLILMILFDLFSISFSSIFIILISGLLGFVFYTLTNRKEVTK